MIEAYLEHTMAAACFGANIVNNPDIFFEALAIVDIALAVPLFFAFRFLNRDPETGSAMFGRLSQGERPSLFGFSRGRLAAWVTIVIGLPFIGGGLYPIPSFIAENGELVKEIYTSVLTLFLALAVLVDLLADGRLKRR